MFTRLGSSHHRIYFISGSEYHSYLSVGRQSGFERNLTEAHLMACLYAGLKMYGMNRECYAALVGKKAYNSLHYVISLSEETLNRGPVSV